MSATLTRGSRRTAGGAVRPQWLGRLPYRWAWRLQRERREAILRGTAPEAFWLLEHDPVITTGRRAVQQLPDSGIEVVRTERGGLATWHGPGQLVGYLLIDVRSRGGSVKGTVCAIEEGILRYLKTLGVVANRRTGHPGVWAGGDKLCALGLHFRKGVTMHGFALNLTVDPAVWQGFVPCGISDAGVTSVAQVRGAAPTPFEAADVVGAHLVDTLGMQG